MSVCVYSVCVVQRAGSGLATGRFESRMRWIFSNLPNTSSRTMALGSIQPLTEMRTRNITGGKNRPVSRADNLAVICEPYV
jgi:hypothetical protein